MKNGEGEGESWGGGLGGNSLFRGGVGQLTSTKKTAPLDFLPKGAETLGKKD